MKLPYSPAKGITSFIKLKGHSVIWEQTLKFVVQMSVGRDNDKLGDCLAKLVIIQVCFLSLPSDAPTKLHSACDLLWSLDVLISAEHKSL